MPKSIAHSSPQDRLGSRSEELADAGAQTTAPGFVQACALLMGIGALCMLGGNVVGSFVVPGHDPMAETISDLGAGRFALIQDVALFGYGFGIAALALGLAHLHDGSRRWSWGVFMVIVLATLVLVVGGRNEYGDGDATGTEIHIYLVYGLGAALTLAPLLLAQGLGRMGPFYRRSAFGFAALWIVTAPVFFFLPTSLDGGYERGLGVIATLWMLIVAHWLHRAAHY